MSKSPVELVHVIVLSPSPPPSINIPPPSAVEFDGLPTFAISISLSATSKTVELIVVVVPFTVKSPDNVNPTADNTPVSELNVKLVPLFGGKLPVAAVVNNTLHEVSEDSSATVTFVAVVAVVAEVAVSAFPVTAPVRSPANNVAVNRPELELNVKFVPDFGGKFPVAAVVNNTLQDASDDSSATVTFVAVVAVVAEVAVSALPVTAPVIGPAKPVAVRIPVTAL